MKKIALSLSREYVSHWGFWEGVRELLQNALDCEQHKADLDYELKSLTITSEDGAIPVGKLLLGNSSKREDDTTIGCYGEGFKLALLVLCRMGVDIDICNGQDKWYPEITYSSEFKEECLHINIKEGVLTEDFKDKVIFKLSNLTDEQMDIIQDKYLPLNNPDITFEWDGSYGFYKDEGDPCRVFVKGLYVCDMEEGDWKYSYNFAPERLELDRDRSMVHNWDIQREVARILVLTENTSILAELADEKFMDVNGYTENTHYYNTWKDPTDFKKELETQAVADFYKRHGHDSHPIDRGWGSSKKRLIINKLISIGKVPVEVSSTQYAMFNGSMQLDLDLDNVLEFKPLKFLTEFLERNKRHMRSKPIKHLQRMIKDLKIMQGVGDDQG